MFIPEKYKIVGKSRKPMRCVLLAPENMQNVPMNVHEAETMRPVGPESAATTKTRKINIRMLMCV